MFFLNVSYVEELKKILLEVLSPDTPIAILYRLTQKDEKILFGTLKELNVLVKKYKKPHLFMW